MAGNSIFHPGDLQSGISTAIQQHKLVACFIRGDDNPTSSLWEQEWLAEYAEIIAEKAVLLRIEHGSQEAGFLGAFCTIERAPALVVIHNGRVLEKLGAEVGKEEWEERVLGALGLGGGIEEEEEEVEEKRVGEKEVKLGDDTATGDVAQAVSQASAAVTSALFPQSSSSSSSTSQPQSQLQQESSQTPTTLFPDRSARLEAEKAQRDADEKAARTARQEARRKEAEEAYQHHRGDKGKGRATDAPATGDPDKARARDAWLYQQKLRKDEAKKEKERILERIEADKAERRLRAQRAKEPTSSAEAQESPLPQSRLAAQTRSAGASGTCALLIRLFDGSSVRGKFSTSNTLGRDVRNWIKEQAPQGSGGADIPFTFRQILAPRPSRSIEMSEEFHTLADLELVPNATLVLVPVAGSVSAYAGAVGVGGDGSWLGWGYGLASSAAQRASYFLPSFSRLYLGGTGDPEERGNSEGAAQAGADSSSAGAEGIGLGAGAIGGRVRVKTLADQRAEAAKRQKRTEFYNGNSSAFEGRKGDDGEDDEVAK
ncbi:hypothetical protein LTR78_005745 [Recurvomyces mirabilis]|uniref:UBX domain-containing protein n=1 Tax=Recurvomyces mirabilis TaxID=574656 RepID=A0AAE1C0Z0_9PEZI|nr:hypothetical protein LTR78_005745 [Recurvomyces mirabilis]KAK5154124.1 hypothetical protein LTS14_006809 [Recurvomyces mirabilis]